MADRYDVVVAGGGPVGMWLAAELRRAEVRVVVLEKRARRSPHSKALTVYPRTIEMFATRGLAERFISEGAPVPSSHFAILDNRLDFSFLGTRYPFTLFLPQRRTEELLSDHLAELGVPLLRSHEVTAVRQSGTGVEVEVSAPSGTAVVAASFAVGCDGADTPSGRRRAHSLPRRGPGPQPRPAGRRQPRLEARRGTPRLGPAVAARQL